jgi:hypothetical protein
MYYGIQFNANGTETDMGYRYLTTDLNEAQTIETFGPADKRAQRDGCYFRELGVNSGTAILGYIFQTQQPGTTQMFQLYRFDQVEKPTRLGGTQTLTTPLQQEIGDHVYTTKTAFEMSQAGSWRQEAARGFVRELSPNVGGSQQAARRAAATSGNSASSEDCPVPRIPDEQGWGGLKPSGSRLASQLDSDSLLDSPSFAAVRNPDVELDRRSAWPSAAAIRRSRMPVEVIHHVDSFWQSLKPESLFDEDLLPSVSESV